MGDTFTPRIAVAPVAGEVPAGPRVRVIPQAREDGTLEYVALLENVAVRSSRDFDRAIEAARVALRDCPMVISRVDVVVSDAVKADIERQKLAAQLKRQRRSGLRGDARLPE